MRVFKEPVQFSGGVRPATRDGALPTAVTGTIDTESDLARTTRQVTLVVTNSVLSVADADDFGSLELLELPTNPIALLSVELGLTATKDGAGLITTTDVDFAVGTAAATATDLTTTPEESDVVDVTAQDTNALEVALAAHSASNAAPAVKIMPSGAKSLFLNVSAPTETSEDGALTVSGTVKISWMDLG